MEEIIVKGKLARGAVAATAIASTALVLSLVSSAWVITRAYLRHGEQTERRSRALDVTGSARSRITSDLALWSIRVGGEGKSIEEAYAKLATATASVSAFLASRSLSESVQLAAIDTTTHYRRDDKGHETRDVIAYTLTRTFEVTSREPSKIAAAAGLVTEILRSGAHVESLSPRYVYTRLADLKIEMLGRATANGRERAERIAGESRCHLGALRDARAGVLQVTPPFSMDVSDSGINDTTSIDKDVTSVIHLSFLIEPEA